MHLGETLYIVMPAYNEAENLEELVSSWHPLLKLAGEKSRLLIINDGSKDNTAAVLEELKERYPGLEYRTEPNSGHGPTVLKAYRAALEAGADYIFQTDSDNQTKAADFPDLWLRRHAYDVLMGYRRKRTDGRGRLFVSRTLSTVLFFTFGAAVKDANVPFRLYPRYVLEQFLPLFKDPTLNLPNPCLTALAKKSRLKVYRHEIAFPPRSKGTNTINFKRIFSIALHSLRGFVRISRAYSHSRSEIMRGLDEGRAMVRSVSE